MHLPIVLAMLAMTFCGACAQSTKKKSKDADKQALTYTNIDVATFDQLRSESDCIVLDVRTPEECGEGMVDNAVELDFYSDDFETKLKKLDRNSKYLVYCRSGGRSSNASEMMISLGFKDVSNLEGGYTKWSEEHQ